MANLAVIHDEHQVRLETKLRRELGDQVLSLLNEDRTKDILLNPDGDLRVKRMSERFTGLCEVPPAQAAVRSALLQLGVAPSLVTSIRSSKLSFL